MYRKRDQLNIAHVSKRHVSRNMADHQDESWKRAFSSLRFLSWQVGTGADGQLACYASCVQKHRARTDWYLAAVCSPHLALPVRMSFGLIARPHARRRSVQWRMQWEITERFLCCTARELRGHWPADGTSGVAVDSLPLGIVKRRRGQTFSLAAWFYVHCVP